MRFVWSGLVMGALAFSAQAYDGRITFIGAIVNDTCSSVAVGNTCINNPARPNERIPANIEETVLNRAGDAHDPQLLAYALNRQAGVSVRLVTVTYP